MRRRDFIAGLGAAAWPRAARAQQRDRLKRLGVLLAFDQATTRGYLSEFRKKLEELGWVDGRNLHMDVRWADGSADRARLLAKELVDLQADVILAETTTTTAALQQETRTIPIVFVTVADPIGAGFVAGLPRPGGNITGFISQEAGMAGKWLELLKEIAPDIKHVGLLFNPDTADYVRSYYLPVFESGARTLQVALKMAPVHGDAEIKTTIESLGREPSSGLIVAPDPFTLVHRASIISATSQSKVPAIYRDAVNVKDGGLLSYGPDLGDTFRQAAPYIDRILRGAKPSDLPVQLPINFEMALNNKTATALGLTVPPSILVRATEVVE